MLEVPRGRVALQGGRRVRVARFTMDVRPVTNHEFAEFVKDTGVERPPWMFRPGFGEPEQPVVGVTYDLACRYARWAGKRLPTESEWVRAARGDDGRAYPWGDSNPDAARAHFAQPATGAPSDVESGLHRLEGAGPYGHRELVGNVWEWCEGAVLRGGFWGSNEVTIDVRLPADPSRMTGGIGFRCAR